MKNCFKLILSLAIVLPLMAQATTQLDQEMQGDVTQFVQQQSTTGGQLAAQMSVLLPGHAEPQDYVAGMQTPQSPANTAMLVQYGSITKEFTSSLILKYMLQNPNAISLQSTLAQLFPLKFYAGAWPAVWAGVTVQQLMTMTSGIPNYTMFTAFFNPNTDYTLEQIVQDVASEQDIHGCSALASKGCFAAGSQWFYSNTNYMLLGMIVEKLYGIPYNQVIYNDILQKQQGEGNTVYYVLNYSKPMLADMINGYDQVGYPPYIAAGENVTTMPLEWAATAGALTGNTHGLVNIIHNLFNGNILSLDATQMLMQDDFIQTATGQPVAFANAPEGCSVVVGACYGLGIEYAYDPAFYWPIYSYSGMTLGYITQYIWLPNFKMLFAFSMNEYSSSPTVLQSFDGMMSEAVEQAVSYAYPNQAVPLLPTNALLRGW